MHYAVSQKRRYAKFLRKSEPNVPFSFFLPYLDVIVRKNAH
jgi:hypothetical protein